MPVGRLSSAFARAKAENRAALVAYVMAGDRSQTQWPMDHRSSAQAFAH